MGFGSPLHWILLGIVAIVLFGGGRFPNMMADLAKGMKSFKKGMSDDDEARPAPRLSTQPHIAPNPSPDLQTTNEDRPQG